MAGGGGGAWKVAYADFVTAMMAFFLVMWITAQNKAVKESIAQYFENPLGVSPNPSATSVHGIEGASANAPLEGEQAGPHGSNHREPPLPPDGKVNEKLGKKPPAIRMFERLGRMRDVGTIIQFGETSTELDEEAKSQLRALLPQLMGKPNKIELRGHASRQAPVDGPEAIKAWELCFARCVNTMRFLTAHGIEPERLRLSQDGVFEPYSDESKPLFHPLNSRVEIYAVSELSADYKDSPFDRAGDFSEEAAEAAAAEQEREAAEAAEARAKAAEAASGGGHGGHGGGHGADSHGGGHGAKSDGGHGSGGHGSSGHGAPAKAKSSGHGH